MEEYLDIKLINCNRSGSLEGRTNNNINPAIFTNPLQETIHLKVGDAVSLERAFVNEVGAGNQQTIELKGENRKVRQADRSVTSEHTTSPYTDVVFGDIYKVKSDVYDPKYRLGHFQSIRTTEITSNVEIRDNLAAMIIGYYITANEYPQYVQQPRRWLQRYDIGSPPHATATHGENVQAIFTEYDSTTAGFCLHTVNPTAFVQADWYHHHIPATNGLYKQKVDNSRFTMFIKDTVSYRPGIGGSADQYPAKREGVFSECTYYRLREKIDLEVKKGFNTPSSIADQLTEQLTKVTKDETFEINDATGYPRAITQIVETPTYKPINACNYYHGTEASYTSYMITQDVTQSACNYIASMAYIAVKRPEIFEKGREMHNQIRPAQVLNRVNGLEWLPTLGANIWEGFQLLLELDNSDHPALNLFPNPLTPGNPFVINVEYNEDNLRIIREYLDTQGMYNELWDGIKQLPAYDPDVTGDMDVLPETSRFFHMNPYTMAAAVPNNQEFGDDGYTTQGAGNNMVKSTIPVFFHYDDTQKTRYIRPQDFTLDNNTFAYGFAQPYKWVFDPAVPENDKWYIIVRPDKVAGVPHQLFTEVGNTIQPSRRVGHDFHATAFSTAIIAPHSGYGNCDIGTQINFNFGVGNENYINSYSDTSTKLMNLGNNNGTDISPYMTQTYIGSNDPLISYDQVSNRFNIKQLHTANNVGNNVKAGNLQVSTNNKSMYPPIRVTEMPLAPPQINEDGNLTVYKINPRPSQWGYSPTFKPYNVKNQAYRIQTWPETPDTLSAAPTAGHNVNLFKGNNANISDFRPFDAHGGIYIDSWGANEEEWDGSLWDILGFDYNQINAQGSSSNVLSQRVTNNNIKNLYKATTNCEIVATDTKAYVTNNYGANMYLTSLPYPQNILQYAPQVMGDSFNFVQSGLNGTPLSYRAEIVIPADSISIVANNLAKSVLKPYYTIRSSILEGFSAIGGDPTGSNLPLMSIVDKYSAQNDYFLGNPSDIIFTCTKEKTIADITTSIHDPDGSFANVDNTSAVIYKIQRKIENPTNIIDEILADEKDEEEKDKK